MSGPNATVWSPNDPQEGEYTQGTIADVIDSTNNFLVDSTGNNIVDGGVTFTPIPTTTWSTNDTA